MTPSTTLDLSQRSHPPELMDHLCSYDEYRTVISGLCVVNKLALAYRPTFNFLNRIARSRMAASTPLRILDAGCGDGDLLRRVAQWAAQRSLPVALTGIDLNPHSTRAAMEATARSGAFIEWISGDALSYRPVKPPDIIISSQLTHHLSNPEIVRFLRWMEATAREGWFVSDLHRHAVPFHFFRAFTKATNWHPVVIGDGLASIQRAFSPSDWRTLCNSAGLSPRSYKIQWFMPFRLCVSRIQPHVSSAA